MIERVDSLAADMARSGLVRRSKTKFAVKVAPVVVPVVVAPGQLTLDPEELYYAELRRRQDEYARKHGGRV